MTADGPLTRSQLARPIAAAGIRVEGQALVHILLLATLRGLVVRGPVVDGDHAFVLVRDWLGSAPPPTDPETSRWASWRAAISPGTGRPTTPISRSGRASPLATPAAGSTAIAAQLVERDDGLAAVADRTDHAAVPPPRLLGAFDPSLHGWVSREPITGSHQGIVTTNGFFRPFAMVKGRAVATWTLTNGQIDARSLRPAHPRPRACAGRRRGRGSRVPPSSLVGT